MSLRTVEVRRSAWRMWAVSLAAIPLLMLGADILRTRWLTNKMIEIFYVGGRNLSSRDSMWGWLFVAAGIGLLAWGLLELVNPTLILKADKKTLELKLAGPTRPPVSIPWGQVEDLGAGVVEDDGTELPVFWVRVSDPEVLPSNPWGARYIASDTVAILTSDWEESAAEVVSSIKALGPALGGQK